ncbi:MAG: hypothetical protein WEC34_11790 [Acidimicrobiia bacterium]|jgi:hypothetical protein
MTATTGSTSTAAATLLTRVGLLILAVQGLLTGAWATVAPRSFYDDFPGFGLSWVSPDGPYNEHLMRDYGALNLALGAVALGAAIWLTRTLVITAAGAWIVSSIPHIVYHALNGEAYDTSEHISIVAGLFFAPIVAIVVLWSQRGRSDDVGAG